MIKYFLRFVEIKTKVATLIPFLFTLTLMGYYNFKFDVVNLVIFFIGMICFDMATTAINSYHALVKETDLTDADAKMLQMMKHLKLTNKFNLLLITILLTIATLSGILLVFRTNLLVLMLGMFCFGVGVLYSYGPLPICRTPLGEVFSGLTIGFVMPLILIVSQGFHIMAITNYQLTLYLIPIFVVFMALLPITLSIANIMLANNITDTDKDLSNGRYTLSVYLGRDLAMKLLLILYGLVFLAIVFDVALGIIGYTNLLVVVVCPVVFKNAKKIAVEDDESYSIKNFLLISALLIVLSLVSVFI